MMHEGVAGEYIELVFKTLLTPLIPGLPSQCVVCHAWPSQVVCDACVAQFAQPQPRCQTCALPVVAGIGQCGSCLQQPPLLDACVAAVNYAYPWSDVLVDYKFRQQPGRAAVLALLMRSAPWVEPALEQADMVVPIPLSAPRLQARGYNQAVLLARALEPHKTNVDVLLRIKHAAPQSQLTREERLHNLNDAFAVEPLRAQQALGKRVVLVDDVMTSGATLHAACQALKAAGAIHVTGLVFARTP